ncbi:hypothetical protein [Luteipulveratus mongoliensis]|uniref:Uncharacterized protein n=1 Tax=Luteipulveratus mongoliensis TaxID=571913 RepID=A0A0K1JGQ7_9MICO|nr:hypothetical protein [Luteipulveratus mongoliensis]AKU15763.1 hypothetical protein VV02_07695 [Luteipulveratus mongoliensis]
MTADQRTVAALMAGMDCEYDGTGSCLGDDELWTDRGCASAVALADSAPVQGLLADAWDNGHAGGLREWAEDLRDGHHIALNPYKKGADDDQDCDPEPH